MNTSSTTTRSLRNRLFAGLLLPALLASGCAGGRFRYNDTAEHSYGFESRDLEQLIADSGNPTSVGAQLQVEQVSYAFSDERDEYRLGRNDVVDVNLLGHPEIGSRASVQGQPLGLTVRKDGKVWLPMIGGVQAEGHTITEFEGALREAAARFFVDPQVSVEILKHESQKFFVVGEVRIPGAFPVDGDTTLLEALSLAGGVPETGSLVNATIVRAGVPLPIDLAQLTRSGDLSRNVFMRAGDVVFVPDNADQKVFVLGEVKTPGVVKIMRSRITLAEAIATVGGPTPARSRREIAIIRGGFANPVVYRIDLERALLVDEQILLRPGDRVMIAPTGLATASRYMEQFLPFLVGAQALGLAATGGVNVGRSVQAAVVTAAP
ncbi:MAG: SLBB domain-containing protein [Deltaproteobacteria bacterium]|nr:SLBB domain-containing protein [Nannocystaceae bacterium]